MNEGKENEPSQINQKDNNTKLTIFICSETNLSKNRPQVTLINH